MNQQVKGGKTPLKFYNAFWEVDRWKLPLPAQEALVSFLERLQENPSSEEIREGSQTDGKGHFANLFHRGFAVYWSIETEGQSPVLSLFESPKPVLIKILDVREISLL